VKVITSWVGFLPAFDAYSNEATALSQGNPLLMINAEEDQLVLIEGPRLSYDFISNLLKKTLLLLLSQGLGIHLTKGKMNCILKAWI